ncbi:substrate-binding domain-containing protein [Anaerobacillus sp. CMMVII]|uniref:substrate-binding domain-containing protein n=1 Tax=Anaerobacillus sp. CMMVII TaxID=2755588 RepID=UPI0028E0A042|nr:substrate-binding domain-containing protein [Anaerobacillus sp. CMMVII]
MRGIGILMLTAIFFSLCYLTFVSADKVFRNDWQLPTAIEQSQFQYRLVLITRDMETPFWNKVGKGAMEEAGRLGASLEIWGSYDGNQEDFLKKIDIALHSKVDGIIVQGLDTEEFKSLTKVKASSYGIPIITVANDVPIEESLRRTYVGSNQYRAGKLIAKQLLDDMGDVGTVVLMYNNGKEYFQMQRLQGIESILHLYPNIQIVYGETEATREEIISNTKEILNKNPEVDAFIAVDANITGTMIQEINKRFQVEPYYIYTLDDGPDSLSLLTEGKLDGLLQQSPK